MSSFRRSDSAKSLARVEAVFTPAALGAKRQQLADLCAAGDSLLFDGAVDWSLYLVRTDRRLKGHAPSLDDAFTDMIATLDYLIGTGEGGDVACTIALPDGPEAP